MDNATLNIEDAAKYIHLGQKAFRALFDAGEIPGVSMNQKHTVFLRSELDAWIRKKGEEQAGKRKTPAPTPTPSAKAPRRVPIRRRLPDLGAAEAGAVNG